MKNHSEDSKPTRRTRWVAVALVLGAASCTKSGGMDNPGVDGGGGVTAMPDLTQAQPLKPGLEFAASEFELDRGLATDRFDFSVQRDLWVRVKLPGMPMVTRVNLKFVNPLGELLSEVQLAFSPDPKTPPMGRGPGMTPLTVFKAKTIPGGYALDYPVPVAGTMLTRYVATSVGTWTVQAKVDGVDTMIMKNIVVKFGNSTDE